MTEYFCLSGGSALSRFRLCRLQQKLREIVPAVGTLTATYVYLVMAGAALSRLQRSQLSTLLTAKPGLPPGTAASDSGISDPAVLVSPRLGTQTPWSTKATDIVRTCGLTQVLRVERCVCWQFQNLSASAWSAEDLPAEGWKALVLQLFDPMTESALPSAAGLQSVFLQAQPAPLRVVDIRQQGIVALHEANRRWGLALADKEITYLYNCFVQENRNPTDAELMMFAQVNSEHCRHKVFNAQWSIDNKPQPDSLFSMIRQSEQQHPLGTPVAYSDNAAVMSGGAGQYWMIDPQTGRYVARTEDISIVCKVETHNHPTAISPFAGAATGSGGEIRDEGATGRGSKPKAGVSGFSISNLRIPDAIEPWELPESRPSRIASSLDIMLDGPIGAASFNNEFGRPHVAGYFRSFEMAIPGHCGRIRRGYHKPLMLAGGIGSIRPELIHKLRIPPGSPLVVLGGPAMLIGLGGGAASSMKAGTQAEDLDFASVQRSNPEMQRRCQEVINACCAAGPESPVLSIHDVGAGGLSNALPELVHDSERGAVFELRDIPCADPGLSPMQIWSNEAQERYVLAIERSRLAQFAAICERERCPYAVVGSATREQSLFLNDRAADGNNGVGDKNAGEGHTRMTQPVAISMQVLFGNAPKMRRTTQRLACSNTPLKVGEIDISEALSRVLRHPTVADKSFLITIGDRSITGLVHRDQMVGPWQVPVADAGVLLRDYQGYAGEAIALGERPPLALINPKASARMAVAEALTNLLGVPLSARQDIRLSANWMAAVNIPGEDAALFDAVQAVATQLCIALGVSIPVGKDSLSMSVAWKDEQGLDCEVASPLSLVITAFAPVKDVRNCVTPQLQELDQGTDLYLLDLSGARQRLGGSILAQVYQQLGDSCPDIDDSALFRCGFDFVQDCLAQQWLLACHDRADGGLITTLCEMAFAARCALDIDLVSLGDDPLSALFNEELGIVLQIRQRDREEFLQAAAASGVVACLHRLGTPAIGSRIKIRLQGRSVINTTRVVLHRVWSQTSWRMQQLRDHPDCANQEYDRLLEPKDPGLHAHLTMEPNRIVSCPAINLGVAPKVAILREQGVNGHMEMARAFYEAGFVAEDITMSDLIVGHRKLEQFHGLAACGGFSYGDVLGAGQGWAKSVLFNGSMRRQFARFFEDVNHFVLGVCNGCQMLSAMRELIPGTEYWPDFIRNRSEQFEARTVMVGVQASNSLFFSGMQGSRLPVVVAHGEGRVCLSSLAQEQLGLRRQTVLQYVDHYGSVTEAYPFNPNGSVQGITGLSNADGRVLIMMPHPERVIRSVCMSWKPPTFPEFSPWLQLFHNARSWLS